MTTGATDADLVQAHLHGDPLALAAIYDRYAPRLYDTAAALLSDRDEAADAVQDTFLAAAEHLRQLRDPARLRAWLFAVLRHEVERRGRKRRRAVPTERVADMAPSVSPDFGADLDERELAAMVRAAAEGLDANDQLVLELTMRQGLEGAELASALGVTPAQSYTLVFRMRQRVSRSLGALIVARTGRRDCAELAELLRDWDGTFSVLVRKRVARHVERCDVCERTKARAALPALMVGAPAFVLPTSLRDRVLSRAGTERATEMAFDADGFPHRSRRLAVSPRRGRALAVAGAVAALAVVAGGVALLVSRDDGTAVEVTAGSTTPVVAAATTQRTTTPTTVATTTTSVSSSTTATVSATTSPTAAPPPPTTPPTTATAAPARLSLSASTLNLGPSVSSATVAVRNTGGRPLEWAIASTAGPLAGVGGGVVQPGDEGTLTIAVDRDAAAEGAVSGTVRVASSGGSATVTVTAQVERPPVIRSATFADSAVRSGGCAPRATTLTVVVSDETSVQVRATVTGPGGRVTEPAFQPLAGGRFQATVGPFAAAGSARVQVVATDARGNSASRDASLPVVACTR